MKPRLLLLEFHHLGDAVLSLPFIRCAMGKYEVWVCCRPVQKSVFEMILPSENILVWEPFWTGGHLWNHKDMAETGRRLKALQAGVVVCGWADPRVHLLMLSSGAARRVGFPLNRVNYFSWKAAGTVNRFWLGKLFQWAAGLLCGKALLTDALQRESWEQAHWRDWQQVGTALNLEVSMRTPWVSLFQESVGSVVSGRKWLLHVGARLPEKRWPVEGFVDVVKNFLEPEKLDWVCVAPAGEGGALPACLQEKRVQTPDWGALLEEVGKANAVLCHDSAVAHLAAALGKPVVSLFGNRPSCWFAPYGSEHLVVGSSVKCPEGLGALAIDPREVAFKMKEALGFEK